MNWQAVITGAERHKSGVSQETSRGTSRIHAHKHKQHACMRARDPGLKRAERSEMVF